MSSMKRKLLRKLAWMRGQPSGRQSKSKTRQEAFYKLETDFNASNIISIVGANGVGKFTFLLMVTGKKQPDSGTITLGKTVSFGIYDQMGIKFDDDSHHVLEFVRQ